MISKGKKVYARIERTGELKVAVLDYLKDLKGENHRLEDYGSPSAGIWFNPTGRFGLHGRVKDGEFIHLIAGRHPHSGVALSRLVDAARLGGVEFVCSPPKDVTILWSAGNAEQRTLIEQAEAVAAERAFLFLQDHAARWRKGAAGKAGFGKAAIIAAFFKHTTSRETDPQFHTHIVIVNMAMLENGAVRALEFKKFLEWRGAASAVYRVVLADQLAQLGVRVERCGRNFILPDVPRGLVRDQSKRRRVMEAFHSDLVETLRAQEESRPPVLPGRFRGRIEKFVREWRAQGRAMPHWRNLTLDHAGGVNGYADAVALATRSAKPAVSVEELEAQWAAERARYRFTIEQVLNQVAPRSPSTRRERAQLMSEVLSELAAETSVIEDRNLMRVVAEHAQGRLDLDDVNLAVQEARDGGELMLLGDRLGQSLFTTFEAIDRERRIAEGIQRRANEPRHAIDAESFRDTVDAGRDSISDEEHEVLATAAQGKGVAVISKSNGSRASRIGDLLRRSHERAGYNVIVRILTAEPETLAATRKLTAQMHALDPSRGVKTCIIIDDDAKRLNSVCGEGLLDAAASAGSKVILIRGRSESSETSEGAALSDYLSEERVAKIVDERRAVRRAERVAQSELDSLLQQTGVPLSELIQSFPALEIDSRVSQHLGLIENEKEMSHSVSDVAEVDDELFDNLVSGP